MDFYKDVSRESANLVVRLRQELQECEAGVLMLEAMQKKMGFAAKRAIPQTRKGSRRSILEIGFKGMRQADSIDEFSLREDMQTSMGMITNLGLRLSNLPKSVFSLVNLYRFLVANEMSVPLAGAAFLRMVLERIEHRMDQVNDRIIRRNLAIDHLPIVKEMKTFWPFHPLLGFDQQKFQLVSLAFVQSKVDKKELARWSKDRLLEGLLFVHEYLAALVHQLSQEYQRVIRISVMLCFDTKSLSSQPYMAMTDAVQQIKAMYPDMYVSPYTILVKFPQYSVNLAKLLNSFIDYVDQDQFDNIFSLDERGKRRMLRKFPASVVPRLFGGTCLVDPFHLEKDEFLGFNELVAYHRENAKDLEKKQAQQTRYGADKKRMKRLSSFREATQRLFVTTTAKPDARIDSGGSRNAGIKSSFKYRSQTRKVMPFHTLNS